MTDLRTAAQQALEVLKSGLVVSWHSQVVTDLEAALAEPCPCGDRPKDQCPGEWEPGCDLGNNPEYARRVNLAEPVQEPYAWMDPNSGEVCRAHWLESHAPERDVDRFSCPLYSAPPQRKPLTEEEIRDLWSWAMTAEAERTATTQQHAFARAVERAHGIT